MVRNYELILGKLMRRAVACLPCIVLLVLMRLAVVSGNRHLAVTLAIPALVLGLFGAFTLCGPLAELFAEFFTSFFFSDGQADRPPPKYGIPESKRAWGHYEEAISEYEKIAEEYPDELKPYVDMIEIAMLKLKDSDRAVRIYYRGMARLKEENVRDILSRMYLINCSRLDGEPEWLKQQQERVITVHKNRTAQPGNEPDGKTASRLHAGEFNLLSTETDSGNEDPEHLQADVMLRAALHHTAEASRSTSENEMDDGVIQWKKEERRKLWSCIIRWCLGIPLLFPYPMLGALSPFFVLLGCILIAPEIAGYVSEFPGNILQPHREGTPQPIYGIAESLVAKGKYVEAEREYEKIIQEFPNEVKPHIDMLNVAVVRMNDGELAEKLFRRGMSLLEDPSDRQTLSEAYERIRTRLWTPQDRKPKPIQFGKKHMLNERMDIDFQKKDQEDDSQNISRREK